MTHKLPPSVLRLAAANPARVDDERGHSPEAQAVLERILASHRSVEPPVRRRPSRRLVLVLVTLLLLAAGAAVAATDRFGFWRSSSPGTAMFAIDPNRHVHTPTAQQIGCSIISAGSFTCSPRVEGRRYEYLDRIPAVSPTAFTRASVQRGLEQGVAEGLTRQGVRRLESDLVKVSDRFLERFGYAMQFTTLSTTFEVHGQRQVVPPSGVPSFLVCEPAGNVLSCRDLNGDHNAAVGSGIYQAMPGRDWLPAPAKQPANPSARLIEEVFGRPLNAAEQRFLIDLVRYGMTASSSSGSSSG